MGIKLDPRYQEEAYEKVKNAINENGKAGLVMPTGTGKSYVALKLIEENLDKDSILYITPSPTINARVRKIIEKTHSKEETEKILSKVKFTTYSGIDKRYKNDKSEVEGFKSDIIIMDEIHRSGAQEWGKAIDRLFDENPNAKLLGMTATPLRNDGQNMIDERIGSASYELKMSEAVALGALRIPLYVSSRFIFKDDIEDLQTIIDIIDDEELKKTLQAKLNTVKKQVTEAKGIKEIIAKNIKEKQGKYLIFCNPGENIEKLQEQSKNEGWFDEVNKNQTYLIVESNRKDTENELALKKFESKQGDDLRLLFSKNMLNESMHNEEIAGEIMLRRTESYILFTQQLGRILSRDRKEEAVVLDMVGNITYFKQFRLEVQEIIREGIEKGDKRFSTDILEQFKIIEEQENYIKAFQEIEGSIELYNQKTAYKNLLEVKKWCEEKFKDAPICLRRMPTPQKGIKFGKNKEETEEVIEARLCNKIRTFKSTLLYKRGEAGEVLNQKEKMVYDLYKEIEEQYDYGKYNYNYSKLLDIKKWCEEMFKDKALCERRVPRSSSRGIGKKIEKINDIGDLQIEEKLGQALHRFEFNHKTLLTRGEEGKKLTRAESELYNLYKEIIDKYDYIDFNYYYEQLLKIEEWCEEKFKDQPKCLSRFPRAKVRESENINNENENKYEEYLGQIVTKIRTSNCILKGEKGEKLTKPEQELYDKYCELCSRYDNVRLKTTYMNLLEIKQWCERNFANKPREERRLPAHLSEKITQAKPGEKETPEQEELRLKNILANIKRSKTGVFVKVKNGEELTEAEQELFDLYCEIIEEYGDIKRVKEVSELKAACKNTPVEICDQANTILNNLIQKEKGENIKNDD